MTIVVLEEGRVAQQGTHVELLAEKGLYRRLWRLQTEIAAEKSVTSSSEGDRS